MDWHETHGVEGGVVAPAFAADAWLHVVLPFSQAVGVCLALVFMWGRVRRARRLLLAVRGKHGSA